jgi:hypothetical protein
MRKSFSAILFSAAIVISSIILSNAYLNRNNKQGNISVTGLGQTDFTSDLIVWEARFSQTDYELKNAYSGLIENREAIAKYLNSKGITNTNIVFSAVSTQKNTKRNYSSDGDFIGSEFTGYTLSQSVEIESTEVEKVEQISREITELLNQGIQLYSSAPRYYYTKLDELKIEMISRATENARLRAERISENSKSQLGNLISGKMGIFQITGQNSNEDYSWGGAYNTSSKEKTASITMKLLYKVN